MGIGIKIPPFNITEEDGSPNIFPFQLKVTNGDLTDNGDGTASLDTSGSGGASEWTLASGVLAPNTAATTDVVVGGTTAANSDIVFLQTGAAVFNEQGNDADFRIEGDTITNLFKIDASADNIAIGSDTTTATKLGITDTTVNGTAVIITRTNSGTGASQALNITNNLINTSTNTGLITGVQLANNSTGAGGNSSTVRDLALSAAPNIGAANTWSAYHVLRFDVAPTTGNYTELKGFQIQMGGSATSIGTAYGIHITQEPNFATTQFGIVIGKGINVFNEDGDALSDFRVEGDTDSNLLTCDAGNDTVGIGIATASATAKLHVDQTSATGAKPVLTLDQADVSEEMVEFISTIGTGNAIEAIGAKTLTTTHFIKVTLPGGLTRYFPVGTIA